MGGTLVLADAEAFVWELGRGTRFVGGRSLVVELGVDSAKLGNAGSWATIGSMGPPGASPARTGTSLGMDVVLGTVLLNCGSQGTPSAITKIALSIAAAEVSSSRRLV